MTIDQEFWLEKLRSCGWTQYRFGGDDQGPRILGHAYFWESCADVVIVADSSTATAYRALPCRDVFAPVHVTRVASGVMNHVLREALSWPEPGTEVEPSAMSAPPGCGIHPSLLSPLTIRPLSIR
jgi:hypothetical protein